MPASGFVFTLSGRDVRSLRAWSGFSICLLRLPFARSEAHAVRVVGVVVVGVAVAVDIAEVRRVAGIRGGPNTGPTTDLQRTSR